MDYEERYTLERTLKDIAFELREVKNSVIANKYLPELLIKTRELELLIKGALFELSEIEMEDEDDT